MEKVLGRRGRDVDWSKCAVWGRRRIKVRNRRMKMERAKRGRRDLEKVLACKSRQRHNAAFMS